MSTPSKWRYFSIEELQCPCGCKEWLMDDEFMHAITIMREMAGFAFPVTSGYRCGAYNDQISSTGIKGPHTTGRALDIAMAGEKIFIVVKLALEHGMTGIGLMQKGKHSKRFIHIDNLTNPHRPRFWTY